MPVELIDFIRVFHLIFFALGMGAGIYLDVRMLGRINKPIAPEDIQESERIHQFVFAALVGLWVTGLVLIYVRTGFQLANFSAKLWVKIGVVTAMTLNALFIGRFVLPIFRQAVGKYLMSLPLRTLIAITLAASASLLFWISGVSLGASTALKTADWPVLIGFLSALLGVILTSAFTIVTLLRFLFLRGSLVSNG